MSNINELAIAKKDYKLADGRILPIGVNFRSLQIIIAYKNGINQLTKDLNDDDIGKKLSACSYILYALIRSTGEEITQEEAEMMISLKDFDVLFNIFQEYLDAIENLQKKTELKRKKLAKLNGQT